MCQLGANPSHDEVAQRVTGDQRAGCAGGVVHEAWEFDPSMMRGAQDSSVHLASF